MIVAFPVSNGTLNGTHTVQSTVQIPYNGISMETNTFNVDLLKEKERERLCGVHTARKY